MLLSRFFSLIFCSSGRLILLPSKLGIKQLTYIQQQQQPIEVIDIYSDSSDSESESDPVTPSVSSYANSLRQQDLNRGTGDVSFQSYSQSAQCDEYAEYEKDFRKDLQCSWRNET